MTSLKVFTMSGCMVAVDVKLIHFLFYFLLFRLSLFFSLLVGGMPRCEAVVGVSINEFFSLVFQLTNSSFSLALVFQLMLPY
jgi:hypothetical protein